MLFLRWEVVVEDKRTVPTAVLLGGLRFYKYDRHNRLLAWDVWTQGHAVSPWCRLVPGKEIKGDGRSRRSQTEGCRAQDQVAGCRASPAGRSQRQCVQHASSQMPAARKPAEMTTGMDQADSIWSWGLGSRLDSWEGGKESTLAAWGGQEKQQEGWAWHSVVMYYGNPNPKPPRVSIRRLPRPRRNTEQSVVCTRPASGLKRGGLANAQCLMKLGGLCAALPACFEKGAMAPPAESVTGAGGETQVPSDEEGWPYAEK